MEMIFSKNVGPIQSKTSFSLKYIMSSFVVLLILASGSTGCNKTTTTSAGHKQVNLVSDTTGYGALRVDANLANAWGIAIGPTGAFWISANHTGLTTIYDRNGAQLLAPVSLNTGGAPTGVVYNSTASFGGSKFIYAGEDGIISAWTAGSATAIMADRSAFSAVYKGITIANDGGANFIYATNFKGNSVDVFDQNFVYVTTKPFTDATIPAGFAPFNIQNIGGKLYVTYAMQKGPDNEDDQKGAGYGYVNVFNPDGSLVKRFASQGTLNSPWGMAQAPAAFGYTANDILVGNFGDGRINVFSADGVYKSQLMEGGTVIAIDGLWALQFPVNGMPTGDQNQLFFTAGPKEEEHGLFGYIYKK